VLYLLIDCGRVLFGSRDAERAFSCLFDCWWALFSSLGSQKRGTPRVTAQVRPRKSRTGRLTMNPWLELTASILRSSNNRRSLNKLRVRMTRHASMKDVQPRTPPLLLEQPMSTHKKTCLPEADAVNCQIVTNEMICGLSFVLF